jgi:CshA-type fibril repeat protein
MGPHSRPQYGTDPVTIAQDLSTVEGQVYRLQFFSGREFGGYSQPGIAGLLIDGYQQLYFKVDAFGSGARYTVDFVAKEDTTNIMFQNWGHAYVPAGETTELVIDTVSVSECNGPMAQPDVTQDIQGEVQTINLLSNRDGFDSPSEGKLLDPASVRLCDSTETAPNCSKTTVTVAGVGTYSVDTSGIMTFTPEIQFIGTPPPLPYTVADDGGGIGTSTYTPTVIPLPMNANPDVTTGPWNIPQSIDLTANDTTTSGQTITKSSVLLCDPNSTPAETAPGCSKKSFSVEGVGTYSVNAAGLMTFTPEVGFSGTPPPITYTVLDSANAIGTSTYTPTVTPPAVSAVDDTSSDVWDKNQVISPLANDPHNANFDLDNSTLR